MKAALWTLSICMHASLLQFIQPLVLPARCSELTSFIKQVPCVGATRPVNACLLFLPVHLAARAVSSCCPHKACDGCMVMASVAPGL